MIQPDPNALLETLNELEQRRQSNVHSTMRRFRRFVVRGDGVLYTVEQNSIEDAPVLIQLRDVGRGGVGFLCQAPLEVNSTWRICFVNQGHMIGHMPIVIRHSQEVEAGVYLIGAQFSIETGLLKLLGVDPLLIHEDEGGEAVEFESPDEMGD